MWREFGLENKIHLVNWDTLCKPTAMGGVSLHKASLMNMALLTKLAWRVLTQRETVWCKVLREKYLWNNEGGAWLVDKQRASKVWKGIVWGADVLRMGARWSFGDRKSILFFA